MLTPTMNEQGKTYQLIGQTEETNGGTTLHYLHPTTKEKTGLIIISKNQQSINKLFMQEEILTNWEHEKLS